MCLFSRAIMVDLEPTVIDEVRTGTYRYVRIKFKANVDLFFPRHTRP